MKNRTNPRLMDPTETLRVSIKLAHLLRSGPRRLRRRNPARGFRGSPSPSPECDWKNKSSRCHPPSAPFSQSPLLATPPKPWGALWLFFFFFFFIGYYWIGNEEVTGRRRWKPTCDRKGIHKAGIMRNDDACPWGLSGAGSRIGSAWAEPNKSASQLAANLAASRQMTKFHCPTKFNQFQCNPQLLYYLRLNGWFEIRHGRTTTSPRRCKN